MISLLLIMLAALFNSVMDAIENENIFESIFRDLDQRFWFKRESWKHSKKFFGYRFDAWHISKSLMIICKVAAVYCEQFSHQIWHTGNVLIDIIIDIIVAGIVWNLTFTFFYHKLFKVK